MSKLTLIVFAVVLVCAAIPQVSAQCSAIYDCNDCTSTYNYNCQWCESGGFCQINGGYCSGYTDYVPGDCPDSQSKAGAIAGSIIGIFFFLACVFTLIWCIRRRRLMYYNQGPQAVIIPGQVYQPGVVYNQPQPIVSPYVQTVQYQQPQQVQYAQQAQYGQQAAYPQQTYAQPAPQPYQGQPQQMAAYPQQ